MTNILIAFAIIFVMRLISDLIGSDPATVMATLAVSLLIVWRLEEADKSK